MLSPRFDTLKIAFPTLSVSAISYPALTAYPDKKNPDKTVYYQTDIVPGFVAVRIGVVETTIEFSAKILKAGYPLLLSTATIQTALENLKTAAPFTFDVREVLRLAHVLKAHQTQHVALAQVFASYADPLAQLHVNRNYQLKPYGPTSFAFIQQLNAQDEKHREYFRVYAKGPEYRRATLANKRFRETLTAQQQQAVVDYFDGKIRLETEINTKRKLRQYFPDIHPNIMLTELLNSTSNPLAKQFDAITKATYAAVDNQTQATALAYAETLAYHDAQLFDCLEKRGFDLRKVDSWLKKMNVPKATQSRERKKYAGLLAGYLAHETDSESVTCLREFKEAIMNPVPVPYSYSAEVSNLEPATVATAPLPLATVTEVSNMEPLSPVVETTPIASLASPIIAMGTLLSNLEPSPEQLAAIRKKDELFFQRLAALETKTPVLETAPWLF